MEEIDLVKEVLKHDEAEIIGFLSKTLTNIRGVMVRAVKENKPELIYTANSDLTLVYSVIQAMDRRNKERGI